MLHCFGFPDTPAVLRVERHPQGQRLRRALLALGAAWGIGVLCILIPIAHFVLVPMFFVAGIFLFARRLGEKATIASVAGACPCCKAQVEFSGGGRLKPAARVQCTSCRNEIDLAVDRTCH